jgi:outer membrane protein assembly factor BamB
VVTPPAATDEAVYVGSRDGYVYALDAGTGEQLWRFWTGGEDGSPPVVADSTVYVVSEGTLYALTEP